MKRSQLLFVAALFALITTVITAPGCGSSAQQRVETLNTAVDFYADQSEQIDQDLEGLRATLAELEALGAEADALAPVRLTLDGFDFHAPIEQGLEKPRQFRIGHGDGSRHPE